MITYTEFFLFFSLVIVFLYAMHWRSEAHKASHLFKLMMTEKEVRDKIVEGYEEFKRTHG